MYKCAQCQREVAPPEECCPGCGSSDLRRVLEWPSVRRQRRFPLLAVILALAALGFLAHFEIREYGRKLALQGSPEGQRLAAERHAQRKAALEKNYKERLLMAVGGRMGGNGQTCSAHLDHLVDALRLYSNEHQGRFPANLSELVPEYVDSLPTCPNAGRDTYSAGYSRSADGLEFDLCCRGDNHHDDYRWTGKPTVDWPRFNSVRGWRYEEN